MVSGNRLEGPADKGTNMTTYVYANVFTWAGNHGVSEASTIFGQRQVDCDLTVRGRDRTIHFVGMNTSYDSHGDIICWEYEAPGTPFTITIYND